VEGKSVREWEGYWLCKCSFSLSKPYSVGMGTAHGHFRTLSLKLLQTTEQYVCCTAAHVKAAEHVCTSRPVLPTLLFCNAVEALSQDALELLMPLN